MDTDPARTIVGGASLGGLRSSYCGLRHPEVFGNVLSQSGSYFLWERFAIGVAPAMETETGWLTRQFARTPKLPLRFYLEVGRFEKVVGQVPPFSLDQPLENRRRRDVLEAKG